MNYRIVKETFSDGSVYYYPQYQFMWIWWYFKRTDPFGCMETRSYWEYEECVNFIKNHIKLNNRTKKKYEFITFPPETL